MGYTSNLVTDRDGIVNRVVAVEVLLDMAMAAARTHATLPVLSPAVATAPMKSAPDAQRVHGAKA